MKKLLIPLFGILLCTSSCVVESPGPPVGAVVVEDRPYYVHGPYYISHGRRWVWVSGHWTRRHGRRVWIHGRYVLRG